MQNYVTNNVANYGTNDYRKNSSNSVRGQARSYSYQIQGQVKRGFKVWQTTLKKVKVVFT